MNVSKPLTAFYIAAALLLAIPGAWLLFAPEMAVVTIHENLAFVQVSNIHSQQTGLGLLLAAAVNLACLLGGPQRVPLHVAVFFYLAGLVASHGNAVFAAMSPRRPPKTIMVLRGRASIEARVSGQARRRVVSMARDGERLTQTTACH